MNVALARFEGVDPAILGLLVEPLQEVFGLVSLTEQAIALPNNAYYDIRGQWLARGLCRALAEADQGLEEGLQHVKLGVTDRDLFTTGLNFVTGFSVPEKKCAVLSTAR